MIHKLHKNSLKSTSIVTSFFFIFIVYFMTACSTNSDPANKSAGENINENQVADEENLPLGGNPDGGSVVDSGGSSGSDTEDGSDGNSEENPGGDGAENNAPEKLSLYETFELPMPLGNITGNKFAVFPVVTFKKGLRSVTVDGFFDGDGIGNQEGDLWLTRFMPDEEGLWDYSWVFEGNSGSGQFTVEAKSNPDNHGHVKRMGSLLEYDDGDSFYYRGANWLETRRFHPDFEGYFEPADLLLYFDRLKETNHNGTTLMNMDRVMNDDRASFDLAWLKRIDVVMKAAGVRGLYAIVNLTETWGRPANNRFGTTLDSSEQLLDFWDETVYPEEKQLYFRYLIARYAGFYNIFWELGNEAEHSPNSKSAFISAANNFYIPWIRAYDPYNLPMTLSEGIWRDVNVDIGGLHQVENIPLGEGRPVIYTELVGGGASDSMWRGSTCARASDRKYYRRAFWKSLMQGGFGSIECSSMFYGTPFTNVLEFIDDANVRNLMEDHGRVGTLIQSLDNELNELRVLPGNSLGSANLSYRVRGKEGNEYILQSSENTGSGMEITLDLPIGLFEAQWFSPTTGLWSAIETVNSGTALTSPWQNQIGVALHLRK